LGKLKEAMFTGRVADPSAQMSNAETLRCMHPLFLLPEFKKKIQFTEASEVDSPLLPQFSVGKNTEKLNLIPRELFSVRFKT